LQTLAALGGDASDRAELPAEPELQQVARYDDDA
jgi:hypothetical protein